MHYYVCKDRGKNWSFHILKCFIIFDLMLVIKVVCFFASFLEKNCLNILLVKIIFQKFLLIALIFCLLLCNFRISAESGSLQCWGTGNYDRNWSFRMYDVFTSMIKLLNKINNILAQRSCFNFCLATCRGQSAVSNHWPSIIIWGYLWDMTLSRIVFDGHVLYLYMFYSITLSCKFVIINVTSDVTFAGG